MTAADMAPPRRRVMVIEDDRTLNLLLQDQLERMGLEARGALSRAEALDMLRDFTPDLAILDLRLTDADGLRFLPELREYCAVMILTAHGSIDRVVQAVRGGACDFLVKPVSPHSLELALNRVFETAALKRDLAFWQVQAERESNFNLVGVSPEMAETRRLIQLFANAQTPVLISGESGVGKGFVGGALHRQSPRANGRFIAVDCAADLSAADLFGRAGDARGDARGAGLIAAAENGTLFLNDIDRMDPDLQAKLLRVIETGSYRPREGAGILRTSTRFLAASGVDLEDLARIGRFRSELYYHFAAFTIHIPALRERKADIAPLAENFLANRSFHRGVDKVLPPESLAALTAHDWPGNLRELRNAVERGVIMSAGAREVAPADMALPSAGDGDAADPETGVTLRFDHAPALDEIRDVYVRLLLKSHGGNRKKIAETLGMSERNTYRLLNKLNAEAERP